MLKCLFIMHDWDGGAEKISLNLAKSLPADKFDTTVSCLHHLPPLLRLIPDGQKFSMPEKPGLMAKIRHFLKIRKMAKNSDVVIGTLQLQSVFAASLIARGKAIAWLRNDLRGKFNDKSQLSIKIYKALLGWALRRCNSVICVSEGVKKSCAAIWPDLDPFLKVHWNSTDIAKIRHDAQEKLPESLEKCFEKPVILGVGRLEEQKNFDLLVKACSLLLKRGHDFNLCLVGRGSLKEKLAETARNLGMTENMFFAGYQQNPYAIMSRSTVLALSSNYEGSPNVLIEALCLGVPVVATTCPSGPDEILCDGKYGKLVPVNDTTALADAIEEVLINPPGKESMEAGKIRAEDFSIEKAIAAWQKLLLEKGVKKNH